MDKLDKDLV